MGSTCRSAFQYRRISSRAKEPSKRTGQGRWLDPVSKKRLSKSKTFPTRDAAEAWISHVRQSAGRGIDPNIATTTLLDYGETNMKLALRGLEGKTSDPYLAGWRKRVVPTLGHLAITMMTNGAVDRAVHGWISDECSRSTVKNSLAVLCPRDGASGARRNH
jgi:hypothetical protein